MPAVPYCIPAPVQALQPQCLPCTATLPPDYWSVFACVHLALQTLTLRAYNEEQIFNLYGPTRGDEAEAALAVQQRAVRHSNVTGSSLFIVSSHRAQS